MRFIGTFNQNSSYPEFSLTKIILPQIPTPRLQNSIEKVLINEDTFQPHCLVYINEVVTDLYLIKTTHNNTKNPDKAILSLQIALEENEMLLNAVMINKYDSEKQYSIRLPRIPQSNWEFIQYNDRIYRALETVYKNERIEVIVDYEKTMADFNLQFQGWATGSS